MGGDFDYEFDDDSYDTDHFDDGSLPTWAWGLIFSGIFLFVVTSCLFALCRAVCLAERHGLHLEVNGGYVGVVRGLNIIEAIFEGKLRVDTYPNGGPNGGPNDAPLL